MSAGDSKDLVPFPDPGEDQDLAKRGLALLRESFPQVNRDSARDAQAESAYAEGMRILQTAIESFSSAEPSAAWFKRAAELGHQEAMFKLGKLRKGDWGGEWDLVACEGWLTRAADLGHLEAHAELASFLRFHADWFYGAKLNAKVAKAVAYYKRGSRLGSCDASCNLGFIYWRLHEFGKCDGLGQGIWLTDTEATSDQLLALAIEYLSRAASQSGAIEARVAAMLALGEILAFPEFGLSGQQESRKWLEMAIEEGSGRAEIELAGRYAKGLGVQVDRARAMALLDSACTRGNPDAQFELGAALWTGSLDVSDRQRGFDLLNQAVIAGNPSAKDFLDELLGRGELSQSQALVVKGYRLRQGDYESSWYL